MYSIIEKLLYSFKYPGFMRELSGIEKNPYKPLDELKNEQDKLMKQIIEYSFKYVPYYKNLSKENGIKPEDIKTQSDLIKLPIVAKSDIVKDINSFVTTKNIAYHLSTTGGSTGEPLKYYLTKECTRYKQLIKHRAWGIPGYKPGDQLCIFAGGSLYNKKKKKVAIINKLTNTTAFSSYGISNEGLLELYNHINENKPKYFYGYASSWVILSEFMSSNNLSFDYKPNALFSTSEVLLKEQRILIEEVMEVEVYDEYGLNDSGASAHECEIHDGKHIDFERAILQVVDDNGNIIENGTGRVIATSLRNYAMPFIRYDTGDIATITSKPCKCGRTTPRLLKIDGRSTDYLLINGVYIGSPVLTVLMGTFDVKTYRIIQENENTVNINLVVSTEIFNNDEKRNQIEKGIKESFRIKVPSAVIEVSFYETMTGLGIENKHKLIINKVKNLNL